MHHAVSSDVQKCLEPERWRVGCSLRTLELAVASEPSRRRRSRRRRRRKKCFATPRWLQQLSWEEQCNSFKQFQDISGLAMQQTKKERMLHRSWTWVLWCPSNLNRSRFASITLEVQCHGMIALAGAIGIHSGIVSTLHSTFSCLQNWTISAYAVYPKSWESSNEFQQFLSPTKLQIGWPSCTVHSLRSTDHQSPSQSWRA